MRGRWREGLFPYFCVMENLLQQIEAYKTEIKNFVAQKSEEAEAFRIKYLGTKGLVKDVMGEMKNVAADKKREFGLLLNEFKLFAEAKYEELKTATENGQQAATSSMDISLPGDPLPLGSRHPIS